MGIVRKRIAFITSLCCLAVLVNFLVSWFVQQPSAIREAFLCSQLGLYCQISYKLTASWGIPKKLSYYLASCGAILGTTFLPFYLRFSTLVRYEDPEWWTNIGWDMYNLSVGFQMLMYLIPASLILLVLEFARNIRLGFKRSQLKDWLTLIFVVSFLLAFLQWFSSPYPAWQKEWIQRTTMFLGNPSIMTWYFLYTLETALLVLAVILFFRSKDKNRSLCYLVLTIALLVGYAVYFGAESHSTARKLKSTFIGFIVQLMVITAGTALTQTRCTKGGGSVPIVVES